MFSAHPSLPETRVTSLEKQDWGTPAIILACIYTLWKINLDPCWNALSLVTADVCWDSTHGQRTLTESWNLAALEVAVTVPGARADVGGFWFSNPPYGDPLADWAPKIALEGNQCGAPGLFQESEGLALVPTHCASKWWAAITAGPSVERRPLQMDWKKRARFLGAAHGAMFPVSLLYWGNRRQDVREVFSPWARFPNL